MKRNLFIASSAAAFFAGAPMQARATSAISDIQPSGEPLRAVFNADAHRVRIMMLVSPT